MAKVRLSAKKENCQSCGYGLRFYPEAGKLKCDSCGNFQDIVSETAIEKHEFTKLEKDKTYEEWVKSSKFLKCDSCGANIAMDNLEYSKHCPYCGSDYVSETNQLPGLKPDNIIPFKFSKSEANKKFSNTVKKKFFVPNAFKKKLPESNIKGIYFPAFSFDANTTTYYRGVLTKDEEIEGLDGQKSVTTQYINVSGSYEKQFKNLLIESSSKLSDYDLLTIKPYNLNEAKKFNVDYIRGYTVEQYQYDLAKCNELAKDSMKKEIKQGIIEKEDCTGVESLKMDTRYQNEKYLYYLLPMYNFEYEYKNKKYMTPMNGQTGRLGTGLPVSGWKVGFLVALGLAFIGALVALFMM